MQADTTTKSVSLNCSICSEPFSAKRSWAMRGARFCSQECYHRSREGTSRIAPVTLICKECNKPFDVKKKVINRALREGHRPRPFCGRACYSASLKKRPAAKFLRKVEKTDGCWLWRGSGLESGYGVMSIGATRKQLAHRFSYELHHGPIPEGLRVLHRCDNPPCVRAECDTPDCQHLKNSKGCKSHLFLGTDADNSADMRAKKRDAFGERHPNAKLTDDRVREIRRRYKFHKVTAPMLAKEFHVSPITILRVVKGERWRHLD